jgi:hypothetical protein
MTVIKALHANITSVFKYTSLYSLPNVISMIKSRRMSWADYVEQMG